MKNPFKTMSTAELVTQELEISRRDLLATESVLEAWIAKREMLIKRIERLQKESERAN